MNRLDVNKCLVMLVEDEPIIQHIHTNMLKTMGCQVDIANSGEQALSKISDAYQIVFMDIGLPGMSGIETIKNIRRAESKYKNVHIVVLTAYASREIKEQCFTVGANAFFVKPINQEKFRKILQDFGNAIE